MERPRRVAILTDSDEEGCVETMRVAEIKPKEPSALDVLMKQGQVFYYAQRFEEAKERFRRALKVARESNSNSFRIAQAASNVSACCLYQQDFQGVLQYVSISRKAGIGGAIGCRRLANY